MSSTFRASPWVTYEATTGQVAPSSSTTSFSSSFAQAPTQHTYQHIPHSSSVMSIMDLSSNTAAPAGPSTSSFLGRGVMGMGASSGRDAGDTTVDMDAPAISTLYEDDTPPSQVGKGKGGAAGAKAKAPAARKPKAGSVKLKLGKRQREDEAEEPNAGEGDEEDQLIDDADAVVDTPSASPKKRAAPKKRAKTEKDKEKKTKVPLSTESVPGAEGSSAGPERIMLKLSASGKGKKPAKDPASSSAPRKSTASASRARGKAAKQRTAIPLAIQVQVDDAMSEAGYTGTAASSPGTALLDLPDSHSVVPSSPGSEIPPSSPVLAPSSQLPAPPAPPAEPLIDLSCTPLPSFPLPTRPFPVQPAPKITSGFAPPVSLGQLIRESKDANGQPRKCRRWDVKKREIRGVMGGRWFVKTWCGRPDEAEAAASASASNSTIPLPPVGRFNNNNKDGDDARHSDAKMFERFAALPGLKSKLPAGLGGEHPVAKSAISKGKGRASKAGSASTSRAATPSSVVSAGPEVGPGGVVGGTGGSARVVAGPSKMRITQLAPNSLEDDQSATNGVGEEKHTPGETDAASAALGESGAGTIPCGHVEDGDSAMAVDAPPEV